VAGALRSDARTAVGRVADRGGHVGRRLGQDHGGRTLVERQVPGLAGPVIVRVIGQDELASQAGDGVRSGQDLLLEDVTDGHYDTRGRVLAHAGTRAWPAGAPEGRERPSQGQVRTKPSRRR
jgi:hypothetical protein